MTAVTLSIISRQDYLRDLCNYPCVQKIKQTVAAVWTWMCHTVSKIWIVPRNAIGGVIRDAFFFPLKKVMLQAQIQKEQTYAENFWTGPLDPNLRNQAIIRRDYSVSYKNIDINLPSGKTVNLTYRIIESKNRGSSHFYNFVEVPGNTATVYNNITSIYSYISSYVDMKRSRPARFISISEYNIKDYAPVTLEEGGFILSQALDKLSQKYGRMDQAIGHSLGCILLAAALEFFSIDNIKAIPRNICFDRGPTSITKAAQKYWYGYLVVPFAWLTGWTLNIQDELVKFCERFKQDVCSFVVTAVVKDHHFINDANLSKGKKIHSLEDKGRVKIVVTDPPLQHLHEMAHHSTKCDNLNHLHINEDKNHFVQPNETIASAIIRHSS